MNIIKKIIINFSGFCSISRESKCIFYHDIHNNNRFTNMSTSIDLFKRHIDIIRENQFEIVPEITKREGQIEICFDDGFQGIYENINIINDLEVPVRVFIITSFIDKEDFLSRDQIKDLTANPFVRFGSHTHKHQDLSSLSNEEIRTELSSSRRILSTICDEDIDTLCYPKGLFSQNVTSLARNSGYRRQYSSLPGSYYDEILPSVKNRSLVQSSSEKEFLNILKGGDKILNTWYRLKHFRK